MVAKQSAPEKFQPTVGMFTVIVAPPGDVTRVVPRPIAALGPDGAGPKTLELEYDWMVADWPGCMTWLRTATNVSGCCVVIVTATDGVPLVSSQSAMKV